MKGIRRKEEGVSPVIATILMVAVTVVLAAVLYVMVMGMISSGPAPDMPLGLNQRAKNDSSVVILISKAPNTAMLYGSTLSLLHEGVPNQVNATLFSAEGTPIANYTSGSWELSNNDTHFENGMLLKITADMISHGDSVQISGVGFGLSVMTID